MPNMSTYKELSQLVESCIHKADNKTWTSTLHFTCAEWKGGAPLPGKNDFESRDLFEFTDLKHHGKKIYFEPSVYRPEHGGWTKANKETMKGLVTAILGVSEKESKCKLVSNGFDKHVFTSNATDSKEDKTRRMETKRPPTTM